MTRRTPWYCLAWLVACAPMAPSATPSDQVREHTGGEQAGEGQGEQAGARAGLRGAPLPAGCGLWAYLGEPCEGYDSPRVAVVLEVAKDERAAEAALERGRARGLEAGYPFATTFAQLRASEARDGIAVVAALFAGRADAERYRAALLAGGADTGGADTGGADTGGAAGERGVAGAGGVELVTLDDEELFPFPDVVIVQVAEEAAAWTRADLERVERELDEALAVKWVRLPEQRKRREARLASLAPRCTVAADSVSAATSAELFAFGRQYAPVRCDDGSEAWVPWRATTLESVVTRDERGARVHQVVLVECDQATVETRRFAAPSAQEPLRLALAGPC
jgi:hypothetical protein